MMNHCGLLIRARVLLTGIFLATTVYAAAPRVEKVDPPSWWANHTINPVRLLVRGSDLHGARVTATTPGIVPGALVVNSAGTYVFVSVAITPNTATGEHPLTLETTGGKVSVPFRIEPTLDPTKNFQGITNDDVIYLLMPDRFANGDPSNDVPRDAPPAATNRKDSRSYHGGDLRGVINHLPYFKELGVTTLWLTPWCDNWNGISQGAAGQPSFTYYHGYHAIDYYGVEDRFGDLATLRELVAKAHAMGLKVIQDQVANHVGSEHPWMKNPPLDNWFHPLRINRPFRADLLLSPHAGPVAPKTATDSWFTERLPDLNQEEPEVARYEIQNALWWVGMTGIDGIRQDTAQYLPRFFVRDLCVALHRQYPRIWMVGEITGRDPAHVAFFLGGRTGWDGIDTTLDSVLDFPLWHASREVFTGKRPVSALRDTLKYDGLYANASRVTTIVGNHDTPRFLSIENGTLSGAMLHTAFTLAVRGTPHLYYGDEIAMAGGRDHASNRSDFPGGFPGDALNAFDAEGRRGDAQRMYEWTRDWLRLRREHPALRRGKQIDLAWDEDSYLFARLHGDEVILIAINRRATAREITAPAAWLGLSPAAELRPLLGDGAQGRVTTDAITVSVQAETIVPFEVKSVR